MHMLGLLPAIDVVLLFNDVFNWLDAILESAVIMHTIRGHLHYPPPPPPPPKKKKKKKKKEVY